MGSDAHVHTDTVVDHGTYFPKVSQQTSTTLKSPEDFIPVASAITAIPQVAAPVVVAAPAAAPVAAQVAAPVAAPVVPHLVVPVVPAAIPALAAGKATTPNIIVDQGDKSTTILTKNKNDKTQEKKY